MLPVLILDKFFLKLCKLAHKTIDKNSTAISKIENINQTLLIVQELSNILVSTQSVAKIIKFAIKKTVHKKLRIVKVDNAVYAAICQFGQNTFFCHHYLI